MEKIKIESRFRGPSDSANGGYSFGVVAHFINGPVEVKLLHPSQKRVLFIQTEAYEDAFKDIPSIGFNAYGEEYIGPINQTSSILKFKIGEKL